MWTYPYSAGLNLWPYNLLTPYSALSLSGWAWPTYPSPTVPYAYSAYGGYPSSYTPYPVAGNPFPTVPSVDWPNAPSPPYTSPYYPAPTGYSPGSYQQGGQTFNPYTQYAHPLNWPQVPNTLGEGTINDSLDMMNLDLAQSRMSFGNTPTDQVSDTGRDASWQMAQTYGPQWLNTSAQITQPHAALGNGAVPIINQPLQVWDWGNLPSG